MLLNVGRSEGGCKPDRAVAGWARGAVIPCRSRLVALPSHNEWCRDEAVGADPLSSQSNRTLAASLAPLLNEACNGRLGDITWFRADWQRGGAATGTSTFRTDEGEMPVVVKLPVVQREYTWTVRLQNEAEESPVVPRLYASNDFIGGYDLAWIIIERFEHGPLGLHWHQDHVRRIAAAIARFHKATSAFEINQAPVVEDWQDLLEEAHANVKINDVEDPKRWSAALKAFRRRVDDYIIEWRARPVNTWLHGDAHLANTMSREGIDRGDVCLIDLAEVHAGHWVEDAVYFERQLWARPDLLNSSKPVKEIAAARKRLGLPVESNYARLAMIRRALLAATAPKFMRTEGNPQHLAACLNWLETAMAELK